MGRREVISDEHRGRWALSAVRREIRWCRCLVKRASQNRLCIAGETCSSRVAFVRWSRRSASVWRGLVKRDQVLSEQTIAIHVLN